MAMEPRNQWLRLKSDDDICSWLCENVINVVRMPVVSVSINGYHVDPIASTALLNFIDDVISHSVMLTLPPGPSVPMVWMLEWPKAISLWTIQHWMPSLMNLTMCLGGCQSSVIPTIAINPVLFRVLDEKQCDMDAIAFLCLGCTWVLALNAPLCQSQPSIQSAFLENVLLLITSISTVFALLTEAIAHKQLTAHSSLSTWELLCRFCLV